ncbi:flagellar hook-length control protein FliK [Halomonas sp. CS7]|uniref:Flagellar hook-length control protein FliK n=1 Tax=Halomonas pelophila TaxID=3151122 RepID=A0ABV1N0G3_9GAMM
MDIQLLINAPGNAAGHRAAAGDAKAPGSEFARQLAGASQAQGDGAGKTAAPTPQASSRQADASLTPLAATHGQGEAPTDAATRREALEALLAKASGETGKKGENAGPAALLATLLGAGAPDQQAQRLSQQGQAAWTQLSAEDVEAALQSLEQGAPRPGGSETAQGQGIWDALQERLALIEQAGRPEADDVLAVLPMAGPAGPASEALAAASLGAGQQGRTNPLLEAIAADRRAPTGQPQSNAAAIAAAAERLAAPAAGSGQATATSDEALRFAAAGDALLAQRGETSRAAGGSELAGQGAANAMTGAMANTTTGASGASAMAQASIQAPVSSPAWSQQLGQQLVRLSQQGGDQRVELKLHPAELGPLSVSLKMSDHGAQAQFVSAHAQVRQALEQAIPQLREALAEQGISLGETSVGEQRQGGSEGDGASARPGELLASAGGDAAEDGTHSALEERGAREVPLDGRVDLYA